MPPTLLPRLFQRLANGRLSKCLGTREASTHACTQSTSACAYVHAHTHTHSHTHRDRDHMHGHTWPRVHANCGLWRSTVWQKWARTSSDLQKLDNILHCVVECYKVLSSLLISFWGAAAIYQPVGLSTGSWPPCPGRSKRERLSRARSSSIPAAS